MSQGTSTIRILVSGAPRLACDAISFHMAAQPGFLVVGQIDAAGVAQAAGRLEPDVVVIIELDSGSISWLNTVKAVTKIAPEARMLVVTHPLDRTATLQAIECGVRGFLTKESRIEMLFKSIRCVMAGEYWIGQDRTADLVDYVRNRSNGRPAADNFGLTARQREVVQSILRGHSNKEIARHFGISGETVKHHLTSIFEKLNVSNRLELALFAIEHPQIAPPNTSVRKKQKA